MPYPPEAARLPQRLLDHAVLLHDRDAILPMLPRAAAIAEVGVAHGEFSSKILEVCAPSLFVAIDAFSLHELPSVWGKPTAELFGGRTHGDFYRHRYAAGIAAGRIRLLEGDSAGCLGQLPERSLDVIYIDADHRFDAVARDIAAARRVVRDDGWIVLNDYIMVAALGDDVLYGVVHAANDFMIAHDWGVAAFALQTQMFCDIALRPMAVLERDMPTRSAIAAQHAAVLGSSSWRATAPLRRANSVVRRLLGRS